MNAMQRETLMKALNDFKQAAFHLREIWEACEEDGMEILHYPFGYSFDDQEQRIAEMAVRPLTFAEFQASGRFTNDLRKIEADPVYKTGFVYAGNVHINIVDREDHEPVRPERYYLILERSEWVDPDREKLEKILYEQWYLPEICGVSSEQDK